MKDNKFWSTVKSFNKKSIFSRYITISLITIFIPLLMLSAFFLAYNSYKLNNEYKLYAETENQKIAAAFDAIIEKIDETHFSLQANKSIEGFFYFTEHPDFAGDNDALNEITNTLSSEQNLNDYLDSVYLYNQSMSYLKGTNLNNFFGQLIDNSWYSILKDNGYNDYMVIREGKNGTRDTHFLTICRNVYMSKQYLGSYVFNVTPAAIEEALGAAADAEKILITDSDENVIYCNHPEFFSDERQQIISDYKSGLDTASKSEYGFTVRSSVSRAMYEEQLSFYTSLVALVFILVLICAVVTSFILSRHFYKSIINIIGILQQTETEDYDSKKENEYEFIHRSIRSIKDDKNSIEEDLAEKLALLKTYQLRTLQEQINPHFLNNTLNLICLLDVAEHKKPTKIYTTVKLLSDLLSGITDTSEYIVPLRTELEYTQKYLDIQNIKYSNKFSVYINAEQGTLKMSVLKFMLQPIVENAIIHGILGAGAKEGTITIDAFSENGFLIIRVKNSGNVIEQSKLKELQRSLAESVPPSSKHIGLLNVNQRLGLVFGKTSSCRITCDYNENTTSVIISLPAKELDM